MSSDKTFQIALLISFSVHAIVLFQNPNLKLFPAVQKAEKAEKLEVSYIKEPPRPVRQTKAPPLKKESFLKLQSQLTADKRTPPPFIENQGPLVKNKSDILPRPDFNKPSFIKPDIIAIKKKITLPPIGIDKINNPSYISYYQIVREKIRRAAYQNYTRTETGEVYISFIISGDGYLKETRLSEDRSSFSPYLRDIALKSVKDASPFPNFPKDLDYPQLSFNVVISFEIE